VDGKSAYEDFAEEMPIPLDELIDPKFWCQRSRRAAQEYAREAHLPWPPKPVNTGWNVTIF
jgi:hypothetical protein